jgi:hypothetical protein
MSGTIWHILGIEPTEDLRAIKRADARRIRENNPEDAPEQFQAIRNAYEIALSCANRKTAGENLKINSLQTADPVNAPSELSREGGADLLHDKPSLPFEATQVEEQEPPGRPVNYSLVDQLVRDVIEAVRSVHTWDEKKKFKLALEALKSESIDTALLFELALSRELAECGAVSEDFLELLIQHYGWHVSYVRSYDGNELQYHVNTLIGRSQESSAEEDFAVVKPGRKESSGGGWIVWIMVVLAFNLLRSCPEMRSPQSHLDLNRKDPNAMITHLEKYRYRAKQEQWPNKNPAIDVNDPNCVRLWPKEDGMTSSIITCAEWEKRRKDQLGQSDDSVEAPDVETPSYSDGESMRVKPYTFRQLQKKLEGRRTRGK